MAFATHLYSRYREGRDPAPRSIRYLTRGKLEQSWRSEHDMDRLIRFQLRLADELQWLSNIAIDLAVG